MIVTIHFHDGHKQNIKCPDGTKWIEIVSYAGIIFAHKTKPKSDGVCAYYSKNETQVGHVPASRRPITESIYFAQLLKVEEV